MIGTKTDYQTARRYLMRKDPVLGTVIKRVGPCELPNMPQYPPFMALAEAIASQQLSVKAADTIFGRFCALFGPEKVPDPAKLLQFDTDTIRGVGFSRSKVVFLRDLASHVVEKRLHLERLHEHDDDQVLQQLTAVKGVGRWTAEIFLMFRLQRPDIFPADDLGLVKAAQRVFGMRQRPTSKKLLKMAEPWRPYRSVAAWYLWRSLTLPPEGTRHPTAQSPRGGDPARQEAQGRRHKAKGQRKAEGKGNKQKTEAVKATASAT